MFAAGLLALVATGGVCAESSRGLMGGGGGSLFRARCPADQLLAGFEVRTGDDIDAIRPLCVSAYGPTAISSVLLTGGLLERRPWSPDRLVPGSTTNNEPWHGGGGGRLNHVLCPLERPIVSGLRTLAGGENTIVIFNIALFCDRANGDVPQASMSVIFDAQGIQRENRSKAVRKHNQRDQSQGCPNGQVAVGIEGRSGIWLDALGLICSEPTIVAAPATPSPPVASIGKAKFKVPRPTSTETSEPTNASGVAKPMVSDSAAATNGTTAVKPWPASSPGVSKPTQAAPSAFAR